MDPATQLPWIYLVPNPQSAYKQLFVRGTRIRARVLHGLYRSAEEPMTPLEIAAEYGLPVEAVLEAIAYCQMNPPEIEQDRQREEARMAATGMSAPDYKYQAKPQLLTAQEISQLDQP